MMNMWLGAGNVTGIADALTGEIKQFVYDALNRLTQAQGNYGPNQTSQVLAFEYYPNGNIKKKDGLTYAYDPARVKPHAVRSVGADTFSYDANGNMTARVSSGVTTAYTYNSENQLTNISPTGSAFAYDDTGERIKKTFGTTTTRFVGDLYEDAGGVTKEYVFAGGARVAAVSGGAVAYYHADHLGGTNVITTGDGAVLDRAEYKPFGEFALHTVLGNEGPYFTDQYSDAESGLYYYGARYYNPNIGRFISPDWIVQAPAHSQSLNRYSYAWNNPVNLVDPSGNFTLSGFFNNLTQKTSSFVNAVGEHPFKTLIADPIVGLGQFVGNTAFDLDNNPGALRDRAVQGLQNLAEKAKTSEGQDEIAADAVLFGASAAILHKFMPAGKGNAPEIGQKVYRIYGDEAASNGKSWTIQDPLTVQNPRNYFGLPNENSGRFVVEGRLKNTTGIVSRPAEEIKGVSEGGGPEILVPNPNSQITIERVSGVNPKF